MSIYVIGDSISIHYGPALERALHGSGIDYSRKAGVAEAARDLDEAAGANGGDSSMVLAYLRYCLDKGPAITADTLVINCGLHDIKTTPATGAKQVPLAAYRQNLEAIVEVVAGTMRRQMVWVRTTPCDERLHNVRCNTFHRFAADCDAYNQAADTIMLAHGIPLLDLYTFTSNLGPSEAIFCDHVHFHDWVRQAQGAFIAGWLQGHAK